MAKKSAGATTDNEKGKIDQLDFWRVIERRAYVADVCSPGSGIAAQIGWPLLVVVVVVVVVKMSGGSKASALGRSLETSQY